MTREDYIEILKQYKEKPTLINEISSVEEAVWLDEALEIAIKALEQEPCEDAISRKQAIKTIEKFCPPQCVQVCVLTELPSVNPQPKTGHWIKCDILQEFKCSECRVCFRNKSNYCPNCGCRMFEPQESEE